MKPTTLCFPINEAGQFLLGCKKRGFGKGKYNGFGGKIEIGETPKSATVREVFEEVSLIVKEEDLELVGFFDFRFPQKPEDDHICYVYFVKDFKGMAMESEEMTAEYFYKDELPYSKMWEADKVWLPKMMEGKKIVGKISFIGDIATEVDLKEVQDVSAAIAIDNI